MDLVEQLLRNYRALEQSGGVDAAAEEYARHKPAPGQKAFAWDESEHPRGQPENAGEFRRKDQAAPAASSAEIPPDAPTAPEPTPPAVQGNSQPVEMQAIGPAGLTRDQVLAMVVKERKDRKGLTYDEMVSCTWRWLGQSPSEWTAVPMTGMKQVDTADGKEATVPMFEFPTNYEHAPTFHVQGNGGICELCGHDIKNAYWIQNHSAKQTMLVGSECVTNFAEGKSGKTLAKESQWKANRDLLSQAWDAFQEIGQRYGWKGGDGFPWINPRSSDPYWRIVRELNFKTESEIPRPIREAAQKKGSRISTVYWKLRKLVFDSKGSPLVAKDTTVTAKMESHSLRKTIDKEVTHRAASDANITRWVSKNRDAVAELLKEADEILGKAGPTEQAAEKYARRVGRGQKSIVFRESDHPRVPAGSPEGGQFAPAEASTSTPSPAPAPSKLIRPQKPQEGRRRAPRGGMRSDITGRWYQGGRLIPTTGRDAARAVDKSQKTLVEAFEKAMAAWIGNFPEPRPPGTVSPADALVPIQTKSLPGQKKLFYQRERYDLTQGQVAPHAAGIPNPNWDETKHPRGNPKNAGQFSHTAGGGHPAQPAAGPPAGGQPQPGQPAAPAPVPSTPAPVLPTGPSPDNPLLRQPRLERFRVIDQSKPKGPIGERLAAKKINKPSGRFLVGEESGVVAQARRRIDSDEQAEADQAQFQATKAIQQGKPTTQSVTFGDATSQLTLRLNTAFGLHFKAPKYTPQADPEEREFDPNDPELGKLDLVKKQGKWMVRPPDAKMRKAWAKAEEAAGKPGDRQKTMTVAGEAARGDLDGLTHTKPESAYKVPREIDNKRVRAAAAQTATDWGFSVDELLPFIDAEFEGAKQHSQTRENAKAWLRRSLGMTAADAKVIDNQGHDYSSAHKMKNAAGQPRFPGMAHFDEVVDQLAQTFPDLGLAESGDETGARHGAADEAWSLMREGAGRVVQPWDEDVILAAARRLEGHRQATQQADVSFDPAEFEMNDQPAAEERPEPRYNHETGQWEGEDDPVPFSRRGAEEPQRYSLDLARDWLAWADQYARKHTPGRGQKQLPGMHAGDREHWVTIRGSHVLINGEGEVIQGPKGILGTHVSQHTQKPPHTGGTAPLRPQQKRLFDLPTPTGGAGRATKPATQATPPADQQQSAGRVTPGPWKPLLNVGPDAGLTERLNAAMAEQEQRYERMLVERDFLAGEEITADRLAKLRKDDPLVSAIRQSQQAEAGRQEGKADRLNREHRELVAKVQAEPKTAEAPAALQPSRPPLGQSKGDPSANRTIKDIEKKIANIQKRIDKSHDNRPVALAGSSRAKITTWTANHDKLLQQMRSYKEELANAQAQAAPAAPIEPPAIEPTDSSEPEASGGLQSGRAKGMHGGAAQKFRILESRHAKSDPTTAAALDMLSDEQFGTRRYQPETLDRQGLDPVAVETRRDELAKEAGLWWGPAKWTSPEDAERAELAAEDAAQSAQAAKPATQNIDHHVSAYRDAIEKTKTPGKAVGGTKMKRDVEFAVAKQLGVSEDEARELLEGKVGVGNQTEPAAAPEAPAPAATEPPTPEAIARRALAERRNVVSVAKDMGMSLSEFKKIREATSAELDRQREEAKPKVSDARAAAMAKQKARQSDEDRRANTPTAEQLRKAVADVRQDAKGQWWHGENPIPKATKWQAVEAAINNHRAADAYANSIYGDGSPHDWKSWSGNFRDILPEHELKALFPTEEHQAIALDPKDREQLGNTIARVNKKYEPEGGWTDADKVPEHLQSPDGAAKALLQPTPAPAAPAPDEEPDETEEPEPYNPMRAILVSADSVEQLRHQDVDRVIGTEAAEHREKLAAHIIEKRPDLKPQVEEAMAEHSPAPPAAAPAAAPTGPYTLSHQEEIESRLFSGQMTRDELHAHWKHFWENEAQLKAELKTRKLPELRTMAQRMGDFSANRQNKGQLIDSIHNGLAERLIPSTGGKTWNLGRETRRAAQDRWMNAVTDEHIAKQAARIAEQRAERKARVEAAVKAIQNPETIDEFRELIRLRGESALTPEQRRTFDDLSASARRESDSARKAVVPGVQTNPEAGIDMEIKQGFHAKKQKPVYVAVLNQRVDRAKYDELNRRAKQLGGYYSAFKGSGAIPGFQFDAPEAAQQFKALLSGDVDRSESLEQHKAALAQQVAANLKERAAGLSDAAQQELTRDRQTNTARRARMAESGEANARAKLAHAKTLEAIGSAMETGELKHLGGVRHATDVTTLDSVLNRARHARFSAESKENGGRTSWEDFKQAPHGDEDVDAVEYPHPKMWSTDLRRHSKELQEIPGFKKLAQDLAKKAAPDIKFKGSVGGFKSGRGGLVDMSKFADRDDFAVFKAANPEGKKIRVHMSMDYKLAQQMPEQRGGFYTADAGKSWGTTPEIAITAALRRHNELDLVDAPEERMVSITDPRDIAQLQSAAARLKSHPNRNLQRVGEGLADGLEHYNRLQRMDIKNAGELRAALREYIPLKSGLEKADPVKQRERQLAGRKIEGFFPTPRPLIDRMLDAAQIRPGMRVLEPSAGKGDILDAIREREPQAESYGIESHPELAELNKLKGHNIQHRDFLSVPTGERSIGQGRPERIVMNPPFEGGADATHVQHAYDLLAPGGRLVAIMSEGPFQRQSVKDQQFRKWLESVGGEHESNPEGSFSGSDAFRKTGVRTRLVTIDKPGGEEKYSRRHQPTSRPDTLTDRLNRLISAHA